ncbi:MAG: hypothetical protein J6S57_00145 [Alphaproteobacteria bacterium]|nr:hypothetical protein [Alphaproteobacteria bacterium]
MQIKMLFLAIVLISQNAFAELASDIVVCNRIKSADGSKIWNTDYKKFQWAIFKKICKRDTYTVNNHCIKMNDIQVQNMAQAIRMAKEYALERYKDVIACYPDYFSCFDNDDHILCATADNSAHYEFVFDDITETRDRIYKKGIGTGVCKIYNGDDAEIEKHDVRATGISYFTSDIYKSGTETRSYNDYLTCYAGQQLTQKSKDRYANATKNMNVKQAGDSGLYEDDLEKKQSDKIKKTLEKYFGYTSKYTGLGATVIDFRTLESCPEHVNTQFRTQQINLDLGVIALLGGYWTRHNPMKKPIDKFKCDLAAHTCKTGSIKNPNDDILDCVANYTDGTSDYISFQFDDLSESGNNYNKGAISMMQCVSETDGSFDGRRCQGLDRKSCDDLGAKVSGGTRWDTGLDACVLNDANKVANIKRALEVAEGMGTTVAIATVTILSGGTTVAVGLVLGGVAAAGTSQAIISYQRSLTEKYSAELVKCNAKECLQKLIEQFINQITYYGDDLTEDTMDWLDRQLADKIGIIVEKDPDLAIELMNRIEKSENRDIYEKYLTSDAPASVYAKLGADVAAVVLDILSISKIGKTGKVFLKMQEKANKLPNTTKAIFKILKSKKTELVVGKIDDINDTRFLVTGHTLPTALWGGITVKKALDERSGSTTGATKP